MKDDGNYLKEDSFCISASQKKVNKESSLLTDTNSPGRAAFTCSWQADVSPRAAAKALNCHAHPADSADVPICLAALAGGILKPPDSLLPEPSSSGGLL